MVTFYFEMNSDLWKIYRNNAYTHIHMHIYACMCIYTYIYPSPKFPTDEHFTTFASEVGGEVEKEERGRRKGDG